MKLLTTLITALTLTACGQDQSGKNEPQSDEASAPSLDLAGSFASSCFHGIELSMVNKDSVSNVSFKEYAKDDCSGTVTETKYVRPYKIVGFQNGVYLVNITQDGVTRKATWTANALGVTIDLGLREVDVKVVDGREYEQLQIVMQKK